MGALTSSPVAALLLLPYKLVIFGEPPPPPLPPPSEGYSWDFGVVEWIHGWLITQGNTPLHEDKILKNNSPQHFFLAFKALINFLCKTFHEWGQDVACVNQSYPHVKRWWFIFYTWDEDLPTSWIVSGVMSSCPQLVALHVYGHVVCCCYSPKVAMLLLLHQTKSFFYWIEFLGRWVCVRVFFSRHFQEKNSSVTACKLSS